MEALLDAVLSYLPATTSTETPGGDEGPTAKEGADNVVDADFEVKD